MYNSVGTDKWLKLLHKKGISVGTMSTLSKIPVDTIQSRLDKLLSSKSKTSQYSRISINNESMLTHRYIWESEHGPLPKGWIITHLNGINNDNNRTNLVGLRRGDKVGLIKAMISRILSLESLEKEVAQLKEQIKAWEEYIEKNKDLS